MSQLAIPDNVQLVKATDAQLAEVLKIGTYLPRLQVMTSNSDLVKESKLPMGHVALIWTKDKFTDLGVEIDIISISVRAKAIRLTVPPIAFFKVDNPEFQKIMEESAKQNSGCNFGPEFLIYIPKVEEFALFHMGSKSARREAGNLVTLMKDGDKFKISEATVKVKFIKTAPQVDKPGYSWHAPQIVQCSTPLSLPDDQEELKNQLEKFNNPPESVVEKVEAVEERPR